VSSGAKGKTVENMGHSKPEVSHGSQHPKGTQLGSAATNYHQRFSGKLVSDLIFVEICAGSAKLTRTARDAGFTGIAIDHTSSRSCGIDICIFELEDQSQVDELCNFLEAEAANIAAIWIAPSCGTASRARERRLPQLQQLGVEVPVPLRSETQPDQLDGLEGTNKVKVEKANLLYQAVEQITRTACKAGIFTGIENPGNSHYWGTTPMANIIAEFGSKYVNFHNCCHGGWRDKLTAVWVNDDWIDSLEARCDKSHEHKSWKVTISKQKVHFPTAEEAAYPSVLCQRIVDCVKHKVVQFGAIFSTTLSEQVEQPDADAAGRIALGALPRGAKIRPLVAEFGNYVAVVAPTQQTDKIDSFLASLPKGSKITSRQLLKRGAVRVVSGEGHFLAGADCAPLDAMVELCWVGVPSEPAEFVARAVQAGHPRGLDVHIDSAMREVVQMNMLEPPFALAKKRVEFFKRWTKRAKELNAKEDELRQTMPEHVRKVVGQKRLVLFKEMLSDLNYPDEKLVDDIASGFRLSGYMTKSNVFRTKSKRPAMSLETLKKMSRAFNATNLEAFGKRQEAELEEATWRETEAELEKGWIFVDNSGSTEGKFLGRRFGLQQGHKIRVIDDCTCCGLNLTVGLHEKFKLHSVDFLAALIGFALKICPAGSRPQVRGRTYDLRSAYKQFAVHPMDRATLRMGVNRPGSQDMAVIGFNSLPFGAVGSVAGFLRISQAIWYVGYFGLGLLWSAFYDDFTLLSRAELEHSSSWACESLLDLLGMDFAREGHKCVPFSDKFKTLGLEINTQQFEHGAVQVGHTEGRREELQGQLAGFLQAGCLGAKDAERLRGRMIFFEGYTFGRVANSSVKAVGRCCMGPIKSKPLDEPLRRALLFLQQRVAVGKPLTIEPSLHSTWYVFTDGACEPETRSGSVGGVLYSPSGECLKYFGGSVPSFIMQDLLSRSQNPIHELEILPVVIAATLWGSLFSNPQVVYYIDNESARLAYVRGDGETLRASKLIQVFVEEEARLQHRVWFGRVPSFSNPADDPSRLKFDKVKKLGAMQTNIDWEKVAQHLELETGAESGRC